MQFAEGRFGLRPHRLLSYRGDHYNERKDDEAAMLPVFHLMGSRAFYSKYLIIRVQQSA